MNISKPDPDFATWKDHAMTKDEVLADRELQRIQEMIDDGELPKIQFDFDSDVIREESHKTLTLIADWFLRHPRRKVRVRAHTCDIGSAEYNMELSERRGKSVTDFLVKLGVPPTSIRFKGAGLTEPLVPNDSEEARERNRRVEFRIVTRDWEAVY